MPSTALPSLIIILYMLTAIGIAAGIIIRQKKLRRERVPFDDLLLRGPGESLRREMEKMDETFPLWVIAIPTVPFLLGTVVVTVLSKFGEVFTVVSLIVAALILIGGLIGCTYLAYRHLDRRRNYQLGYLGERYVAERLQPLLLQGYQIFHDIPIEKLAGTTNIDHVVVGKAGIFAIETKTRRKRKPLPGKRDHEVTFNGKVLRWPWGQEDSYGVRQAQRQAKWLREKIHKLTKTKFEVQPILTLPGWKVDILVPSPEVSVQNSKNLITYITARDKRMLTDKQIQHISAQLEALCRDVRD